ncbi:MAG: tRNA lysidine(34) synthetase TilS [Pseudomonadota bacterium]
MTAKASAQDLPQSICAWLDTWSQTVAPAGPIGIAVSGGGDSVALLRLASDWARSNGKNLHVLTVDHGLRTASAVEASFVEGLADKLGWPSDILVWPGGQPSAWRARKGRHDLLARACQDRGIQHLMLGHTLDDQVETFLMRARQGSGWYGLGGIDRLSSSPSWPDGMDLTLVRPLLAEHRSDLRDLLTRLGQDWVDDPTNEDEAYERVRMRNLMAARPDTRRRIEGLLPRLAALRQSEQWALADAIGMRVTCYPDGSLDFDPAGLTVERAVRVLGWLVQTAAGGAVMPRETVLRRAFDAIVTGVAEARTLAGAWLVANPESTIAIYRDEGSMANPCRRDGHFDGRFARAGAGEPILPRDWRAAKTLPADAGHKWRALTGPRLAHLCSIWRRLPKLSQVSRGSGVVFRK